MRRLLLTALFMTVAEGAHAHSAVGILPREENPGTMRGTALQINQVLQQLEDGKSVFRLDAGSHFVARDGTIPRALMPDFLHLSPRGYAVWAEATEPRIAALLATP